MCIHIIWWGIVGKIFRIRMTSIWLSNSFAHFLCWLLYFKSISHFIAKSKFSSNSQYIAHYFTSICFFCIYCLMDYFYTNLVWFAYFYCFSIKRLDYKHLCIYIVYSLCCSQRAYSSSSAEALAAAGMKYTPCVQCLSWFCCLYKA